MAIAVVKDTHLTVNGVRYFRGHAPVVVLGAYGRKKRPLPSTNYLEVFGNIGLVNVTLAPVLVADIDVASSTSLDVNGDVAIVGTSIEGGLNAKIEAMRKKQLRLALFAMTLGDVRDNVMDDNADDLAAIGPHARVAYEVWVVMSASEADTFAASGGLRATLVENGVVVSAAATAGHTTQASIVLSPTSTYAYLLAKMKKNGTFTTDMWGAS